MPTLKETRDRLSEEQRVLLDRIWQSYLLQNAWPLAWEINHPHRKASVYQSLKPLGNQCIFETNDGMWGSRYQMTLHGILLTTEGENMQELLLSYLHYLRDRYQQNPKSRAISNTDVQAEMSLGAEEANLLGRLVIYGQLYSESASYNPDFVAGWSAGMLRDVEDWPAEGPLTEQLEALTTRGFNSDGPVFLADRKPAYLEGSNAAFVAIWFDSATERLWSESIQPGILEAGYFPFRIDKHEHNNRIDDEILASIRRSRFVVADFTGQRGGVYFEAGFGLGLGLQVVWLCEKSEVEEKKVHFDTRQYNFILWETGKWEALRKAITNRIVSTLGVGHHKTVAEG